MNERRFAISIVQHRHSNLGNYMKCIQFLLLYNEVTWGKGRSVTPVSNCNYWFSLSIPLECHCLPRGSCNTNHFMTVSKFEPGIFVVAGPALTNSHYGNYLNN